MPTVNIDVEIEVWCDNCGEGLCRQSSGTRGGVNVAPCEKCLEEARTEGYDTGHDNGYEQCEKDNSL